MGDTAAVNRAHWDALAARHGQDRAYDVAAFLAGASTLRTPELTAAGDVAGLDLLHLQCHFGLDSLSWVRRGARVTGVDFSPVAVRRARDLAAQAALPARFVEADAVDLPADLAGAFDLVVATYGVLSWIADIGAWMRSAAGALRPAGRLVLVELHPVVLMPDRLDPPVCPFPYGGAEPVEFDEPGSYADPDLDVEATRTVEFAHSLGEVVTAAIDAGLVVRSLVEHLTAEHDPRGAFLLRRDDGSYVLPWGGQELPVLYTLVAAKPA